MDESITYDREGEERAARLQRITGGSCDEIKILNEINSLSKNIPNSSEAPHNLTSQTY